MECPNGMVHHFDSKEKKCMGAACGTEDTQTCCMSDACSRSVLNFKNFLCNNLGGVGPDTDCAEEMRYGEVTTFGGKSVDLVVTASPGYDAAEPGRNGAGKYIAQLNLRKGVTFNATFQFVESGTDTPAFFESLFFSILDMDNGMGRDGEESFSVAESMQYELATPTTIAVSRTVDGRRKFSSASEGSEVKPKNPVELNALERSTAVSLVARNDSKIEITFSLTPSSTNKGSRNMVFAGLSGLVCK